MALNVTFSGAGWQYKWFAPKCTHRKTCVNISLSEYFKMYSVRTLWQGNSITGISYQVYSRSVTNKKSCCLFIISQNNKIRFKSLSCTFFYVVVTRVRLQLRINGLLTVTIYRSWGYIWQILVQKLSFDYENAVSVSFNGNGRLRTFNLKNVEEIPS